MTMDSKLMMLQFNERRQDLALAFGGRLFFDLVLFDLELRFSVPGEKLTQRRDMVCILDRGIGRPNPLQLAHRLSGPNEPELLRPLMLVEDVPSGLNPLIG